MEMRNVPLRGIKVDPLAHELATSEGNRPYLDCVVKAYRNNAVGLEAALQVVRDLPLESDIRGECRWVRPLDDPPWCDGRGNVPILEVPPERLTCLAVPSFRERCARAMTPLSVGRWRTSSRRFLP
jgi:hypothetical protein